MSSGRFAKSSQRQGSSVKSRVTPVLFEKGKRVGLSPMPENLMQPQSPIGETSALATSISELSTESRSLSEVVEQIRNFTQYALLKRYRYRSLIDLLHASAKCPPDTEYHLLKVAVRMVKSGNIAFADELHELISVTQRLIRANPNFVSFGPNQTKPKMNLKKWLEIFETHIKPKSVRKLTFGTSEMERFIAEQRRRAANKECALRGEDIERFLSGEPLKRKPNPSETWSFSKSTQWSNEVGDVDSVTQSPISDAAGVMTELITDVSETPRQESKEPRRVSLILSPEEVQISTKASPMTKNSDYALLSIEQRKRIDDLVALFVNWEYAYEAVGKVWEEIKKDNSFEVDILLSRLPITFASFLIEGLVSLADEEGTDYA
jgi:hypothetical protein